MGQSGGGWLAAGAAILLARENNSKLVKTVFLLHAMLNDCLVNDPEVPMWEYIY